MTVTERGGLVAPRIGLVGRTTVPPYPVVLADAAPATILVQHNALSLNEICPPLAIGTPTRVEPGRKIPSLIVDGQPIPIPRKPDQANRPEMLS